MKPKIAVVGKMTLRKPKRSIRRPANGAVKRSQNWVILTAALGLFLGVASHFCLFLFSVFLKALTQNFRRRTQPSPWLLPFAGSHLIVYSIPFWARPSPSSTSGGHRFRAYFMHPKSSSCRLQRDQMLSLFSLESAKVYPKMSGLHEAAKCIGPQRTQPAPLLFRRVIDLHAPHLQAGDIERDDRHDQHP